MSPVPADEDEERDVTTGVGNHRRDHPALAVSEQADLPRVDVDPPLEVVHSGSSVPGEVLAGCLRDVAGGTTDAAVIEP